MERGPVALFGALIAVGLGPALWLGAQFGQIAVTPQPKPPITVDANQDNAPGRAGAAPDESTEVIDSEDTETGLIPLSSTPSARPSTSSPANVPPTTDPTATNTTSPAPTGSTEPPTTPPTESTTTPVGDPSDEPTGDPTGPATLAPPAAEQVEPLEVGFSNAPSSE